MLIRRYKRHAELEEEAKQLEEQGIEQKETGSFEEMTVAELKEEAKKRDLTGYSKLDKDGLIELLTKGE